MMNLSALEIVERVRACGAELHANLSAGTFSIVGSVPLDLLAAIDSHRDDLLALFREHELMPSTITDAQARELFRRRRTAKAAR